MQLIICLSTDSDFALALSLINVYSNPAMGMDESLTVEGLSVLSEVREVDGYVQVENTNQEDLTNLR